MQQIPLHEPKFLPTLIANTNFKGGIRPNFMALEGGGGGGGAMVRVYRICEAYICVLNNFFSFSQSRVQIALMRNALCAGCGTYP